MKTEISVIIPFYENYKLLKRAVHSVINQSYKRFEIIIILDDPLKKNSLELKKIVSMNSKVGLIVNKKNIGAGLSRNKGIKIAKGKYISFLDSDDYWKKQKLAKQLNFMKKKKLLATHTSYDVIDIKNNFIKKRKAKDQNYAELLRSCDIGLSTVMLSSKLLKNKSYFPNLKTKEDYVLWLNITKKGIVFKSISESLTKWTDRPHSLSKSIIQKLKDGFKVYNKFQGHNFAKSLLNLLVLSLNFLKKK